LYSVLPGLNRANSEYPLQSPDQSAITERWFDRTSNPKKRIVIGSMRIIIKLPIKFYLIKN